MSLCGNQEQLIFNCLENYKVNIYKLKSVKKDILEQGFKKSITKCSDDLANEYKALAYVRRINFFKLSDGKRELIKGVITEKEIDEYPENFSPNVLLRPLYQETILPNIAYIGGGA